MSDGDPDPISAGTAGDAVEGDGSRVAVGMPANPDGAHQAGRGFAGRGLIAVLAESDTKERAAGVDENALSSTLQAFYRHNFTPS